MSELEEKLSSVLNNPQMMQQIMALARGLDQPPGGQNQAAPPAPSQTSQPPALQPDPGLLQNIAALTAKSGVDENQQALLSALSPYLSRKRVEKLERAMRAARMTELASTVLGSGALQGLLGR